MATDTPLPQILDEARRLTAAAAEQDVPIRLVGGLAVRIRVDETFHAGLSREYKDIDLVTLKGRSKPVARFIEEMGYEPHQQFNAMNGSERLLFFDMGNERQLDVFVGAFRMCHEIPITDADHARRPDPAVGGAAAHQVPDREPQREGSA